jgi:peptidoglycan/LPS O-acetylase OafA/YrhL
MKRVRAIDGYRGIGAVMVVVIHAALAGRELFSRSGGNALHDFDACLPLFFVLSGMVAYLGIVRGAFTGRIKGTRELFTGRLWRILPVYYAVILVVWSMRFAGSGNDWSDLALHLTFTQVWSRSKIFWLDGPSWFLADDLHFFLLVALVGPLVARLAVRRSSPGAQLAIFAAFPLALVIGGIAYNWYVHDVLHTGTTWMLYNPLAKLDEFAEGMVLGLVLCLPGVVKTRPAMANALSALGFGVVVAMGYLRWHEPWLQTWYFEIIAIGIAGMLAGAAMLGERQILSRLLSIRPLQSLAAIGFTIFLVQEPVMLQLEQWNLVYFQSKSSFWISTVALVATCALVAWIAYRLVEEPGYRLKRLFGDLRARQQAGERRRTGPAPRRLPDLVLRHPAGGPVALREMVGSRPLLVALGAPGEHAVAEQRFRLDVGEADVLYVGEEAGVDDAPDCARDGANVVLDPDRALARALNVPAALLEVAPDGLITALHEREPVPA